MTKSYIIPLAFSALLSFYVPAVSSPIFIDGVSETGGWYDVNKKTKWSDWPRVNALTPPSRPWQWTNLPQDNSMCWAAAGANTLQWWQDRRGNVPAKTPNGFAESTSINGLQNVSQLQIFQTICNNWSDGGSHVEQAWNWWFNGGCLSSVAFPGNTQLINVNSGAYWKELSRTCTLLSDASYDTSKLCETYAFWAEPDQETEFKNTIKRFIDNDYATALSLSGPQGGHAVTLWGYEERENGQFVLFLTDSDDGTHGLFKQTLSMNDEGYLCLSSIDGDRPKYEAFDSTAGTGLFVSEIQGLTVPFALTVIPEPSAFGMLAGTLALVLCVPRRQRKTVSAGTVVSRFPPTTVRRDYVRRG